MFSQLLDIHGAFGNDTLRVHLKQAILLLFEPNDLALTLIKLCLSDHFALILARVIHELAVQCEDNLLF